MIRLPIHRHFGAMTCRIKTERRAYDPVRKRFLICGGGSSQGLDTHHCDQSVQILPAAETPIRTHRGIPGFVWHDGIKKFVAWNGGAEIYLLDPVSFVWTKIPPAAGNTVVPPAPEARIEGLMGGFSMCRRSMFLLRCRT